VNDETKARIQRIAYEMGYVTSVVARSLVTRRTHTLGLVVTTVTDLFFAEVIHAVEETAQARGSGVLLANSRGEPDREIQAIRMLRERWVDGIIVVSGCSGREGLCDWEEIGLPVVIINNIHRQQAGYSVEVDNAGGARLAARHLLELGHRKIAHIQGPLQEWDAVQRRRGFKTELRAWDLAIDEAMIVSGTGRPQGGIAATKRLLELNESPTAIFCYNDATALGTMRAARAVGLRIPEELSVVGFDNIDLAPFFEPPLTTIAQPIHEMGERAVEMVLDLLEKETPVQDCILPSQLIVRKSTQQYG
jgi:DNA-binding LacI/PurR family transcriptional regulator